MSTHSDEPQFRLGIDVVEDSEYSRESMVSNKSWYRVAWVCFRSGTETQPAVERHEATINPRDLTLAVFGLKRYVARLRPLLANFLPACIYAAMKISFLPSLYFSAPFPILTG
jgi:hypothetical protein